MSGLYGDNTNNKSFIIGASAHVCLDPQLRKLLGGARRRLQQAVCTRIG
jgi:hypothetical protein